MNFLFQMIIHILNSKTTQKYLLGPWVFVLKLRFVDHQFITTWSGICDIWFVSCYATIVKCQKSKMLKFPQFLETSIEQIESHIGLLNQFNSKTFKRRLRVSVKRWCWHWITSKAIMPKIRLPCSSSSFSSRRMEIDMARVSKSLSKCLIKFGFWLITLKNWCGWFL